MSFSVKNIRRKEEPWRKVKYVYCKLLILKDLLAERVGFEPTCRLPDNTLSRRARYDHFGTSPHGGNPIETDLLLYARLKGSRYRRRALKNACIRFRHASSLTPETTSNR